ncbi:hypothetical protein GCM10027598_34230 [Amycolatopsis oliviviridis]|uniref:DUF3800 domain-containing protein n=1 Tax=Amycolatopsis oliviviridis TaxID=1471590 RepID=A0ABQ3LQS0_9PSEU|nr:hypothetical protein [Amycolatopsis oliviviridis]GHH23188.1 hypothetical protein GCM10017790_45930 [Amycolatopsis oliviviridis]
MSVLQAFADESFREDDHGGFYVLAAAILPVERHAELREDDEPLLWIPDIVAGAVRARRQGFRDYTDHLAECVIELQVDTRA